MPLLRALPLVLVAAALAAPAALAPPAPARAGGLFDVLDAEDQLRARRRNVSAIEAEVVEVAPPGMVMASAGRISRGEACLAGADCSRPAVTAGNYLRATVRAPWIVYMFNLGSLERRGELHDAGELTAHNVIDVPQDAVRPGGLVVRSFGVGRLVQELHD
ncbi:hypothetical protein [Albimonas pacifica]|uniref:Flagella basal body P-ring formation protein FlgA n=1 Tax=Albimonas pacifica TaxID=1114924 RepID=A0A1I3Q1F7_9RHOB|nr:hypothetical protein [Albimonas pacifica]SFJ27291.1 hypothetical protein SAMN05216258_1242 [Albimonas pacifica]